MHVSFTVPLKKKKKKSFHPAFSHKKRSHCTRSLKKSLELGGGFDRALFTQVRETQVRVVLSLPEDDVVVRGTGTHEALVVVERVEHRSVDVQSAQGVAVTGVAHHLVGGFGASQGGTTTQ